MPALLILSQFDGVSTPVGTRHETALKTVIFQLQ